MTVLTKILSLHIKSSNKSLQIYNYNEYQYFISVFIGFSFNIAIIHIIETACEATVEVLFASLSYEYFLLYVLPVIEYMYYLLTTCEMITQQT